MGCRICIALLLGYLAACAEPTCRGSDEKYYAQAVGYQLAKRGIPYEIRPGGMVCVDARHASDVVAAEREAEKYFPQVAHLLKDSCEERAFVEWATRERLRFDIRDANNLEDGRPERMFLLRSFNAEELAANKRRLSNDAPQGVSCPKEKQT